MSLCGVVGVETKRTGDYDEEVLDGEVFTCRGHGRIACHSGAGRAYAGRWRQRWTGRGRKQNPHRIRQGPYAVESEREKPGAGRLGKLLSQCERRLQRLSYIRPAESISA